MAVERLNRPAPVFQLPKGLHFKRGAERPPERFPEAPRFQLSDRASLRSELGASAYALWEEYDQLAGVKPAAWGSVGYMVERTGLSSRTVQRAKRILCDHGLIHVYETVTRSGSRSVDLIYLVKRPPRTTLFVHQDASGEAVFSRFDGACPDKAAPHAAPSWRGNMDHELNSGILKDDDKAPARVPASPEPPAAVVVSNDCSIESPPEGGVGREPQAVSVADSLRSPAAPDRREIVKSSGRSAAGVVKSDLAAAAAASEAGGGESARGVYSSLPPDLEGLCAARKGLCARTVLAQLNKYGEVYLRAKLAGLLLQYPDDSKIRKTFGAVLTKALAEDWTSYEQEERERLAELQRKIDAHRPPQGARYARDEAGRVYPIERITVDAVKLPDFTIPGIHWARWEWLSELPAPEPVEDLEAVEVPQLEAAPPPGEASELLSALQRERLDRYVEAGHWLGVRKLLARWELPFEPIARAEGWQI